MNSKKFISWYLEKGRIPKIPTTEDNKYLKYLNRLAKDAFEGIVIEKNNKKNFDENEVNYPSSLEYDITRTESAFTKPLKNIWDPIRQDGFVSKNPDKYERLDDYVSSIWIDLGKKDKEKRQKRFEKEDKKYERELNFNYKKLSGKLQVKQKKFISSQLPKIPEDVLGNIYSFIEPKTKVKF
jgi:hypothetical protein